MDDLISRQTAIDAVMNIKPVFDTNLEPYQKTKDVIEAVSQLPSAQPEIIHCRDCKHNPKYTWFGCPMSHLSEKQRPEDAWCWKAERREDGHD